MSSGWSKYLYLLWYSIQQIGNNACFVVDSVLLLKSMLRNVRDNQMKRSQLDCWKMVMMVQSQRHSAVICVISPLILTIIDPSPDLESE